MEHYNAAILVIGNEILSGRTQDTNVKYIATYLAGLGIKLQEVRIVPDVESIIIENINHLKTKHTYLFTTGGIGPTHDDITSESVAKACGKKLIKNPEAVAILKKYYEGTDKLNDARLKMAHIPEGAKLIYNPVSAAPGFNIDNIYVLAGVPNIMQAMFDGIKHSLKGGKKIYSKEFVLFKSEGEIAFGLTNIQNQYPDIEIGSYPFFRNNQSGTAIVARGEHELHVHEVIKQVEML